MFRSLVDVKAVVLARRGILQLNAGPVASETRTPEKRTGASALGASRLF